MRDTAVVLAAMFCCGVASLWIGQDVSVDLQIYHFYNGYAFVTGRPLGWDIVPASVRTFFNPLMDAFHYWGIVHLPAKAFGFLLGALHGLNPAFVYLIARRLMARDSERPFAVALVAAVLAASSPAAITLLGTTTGDSLANIPILAAVWLSVGLASAQGADRLRLFAAGVLLGAASGLKLTMMLYAPVVVLAVVVTSPRARAALREGGLLCAGGAAGYLVTAGFRSLQLWRLFGNPLFPFANGIFQSPFFPTTRWPDNIPQAETLWQYLSPPIDMALGRTDHLQELFSFRDARVLLVLVLAVAAVFRRRELRRLRRDEKIVLVFALGGYLAWLKVFYYYRYLLSVELLLPVVLFVLLRVVLARAPDRYVVAVYAILAVGLLAFSRPEPRGLGRETEWRDGTFDIRLPRLAAMPNAIVLTDTGNSFLFPSFPPSDRFCMLHHDGMGIAHGGMDLFNAQIAQAVAAHSGPVLYFPPIGRRQLTPLGLKDAGVCEPLRTVRGRYQICLAEHS